MRRLLVLAVFAVLVASPTVRAEWYVGGFAGLNMPGELENVEGTGSLAGSGALSGVVFTGRYLSSDLELENSLMYGGKVGYFFSRVPWLGIEAEGYTATPNIERQRATITQTVTIGGIPTTATGTAALSSADLRVTTGALNVVFRYPGRRFEPYVGGGVGIYWAEFSSSSPVVGDSSDTAVGVNFLAGARYFLTRKLAAFGEYKYNAANFDFRDNVLFKGDYSAHNFVGGLAIHFK